jgi:hypothetical protein
LESRVNASAPGSGSNFLARVIERAQGAAELALPRVPGLFEPVAATAPANAADMSERHREFEREAPEKMNTAIDAHEFSTREPVSNRLQVDGTARRGTIRSQQPDERRPDEFVPIQAVAIAQAGTKQSTPVQRAAPDSTSDRDVSAHRKLAETSVLSSDPGLTSRFAQVSLPRGLELHPPEPATLTANPATAPPVVHTDDRTRSGILVSQRVVPDPLARQAPANDHVREIPAQAAARHPYQHRQGRSARAHDGTRSSPSVRDTNARRSTRLDEYSAGASVPDEQLDCHRGDDRYDPTAAAPDSKTRRRHSRLEGDDPAAGSRARVASTIRS